MEQPAPPATASSTYDEVPYAAAAFAQSHPDRLATLARLLGLTPPALDTCRVLELGCASGDNVIPMAVTMPNATFVGVDLSLRQIEQGRQTANALKLPNIELRHEDIADIDDSYGRFDYIIAHGVYSWVPEPVREKLLAICHDNLAGNGVAYVSYNTLPGWRMRGMIRDMMVYHSRQFQGPRQQIEQARALLDFLAQSVPANTPYGMMLKQELDGIRTQPDAYIYHDHLEVVNEPVYFHEFEAAARRHGLQYLADVEFSTMLVTNFPPPVAETLMRLGTDLVRAEQYMDFMRNRMFRQSLLVRDESTINRKIQGGPMYGFQIASRGRSESARPSLAAGVVETYIGDKGMLKAGAPISKAAMLVLGGQWPVSIPFERLVEEARAKLGATAGDDKARPDDAVVLGGDMLQAYSIEAVELHVASPQMCLAPSTRPVASPLARLQAARGAVVTSLRHEPTRIDGFCQRLLPLLDGTRDRAMLVEALVREAAAARPETPPHGDQVASASSSRETMQRGVESALANLGRAALLIE